MTSLKSHSMTQVTLTTVDGHALKRRRVDYPTQRKKSESILNSPSTPTSVATVSAPLPSVTKPVPPLRTTQSPSPSPPKRLECTSPLSSARRSPSLVPTELDIDSAEQPDIDAHLYKTHKIKVIDYASSPPTTNFPRETGSDYSFASRIPEAFFAKDAIAQYEWFMARGSREWDHMSQQVTEVWEDDDDNKEKTQTEPEIRQQQTQTTPTDSKPPAQSSPRRGQPLKRQLRVPLNGIQLFNDEPSHPATEPLSTPPASSAKPAVYEQVKTPLLPSFTPQHPLANKPKRTYPIPGRLLYRLREIKWVTDDEARQRWLSCDWEEYYAYETREREKYKDGERGYMCKGDVGYPYWVVWRSPPSPQGSKKGKEKERAPELQPAPGLEPRPEPVEPVDTLEEEIVESQNVHATLSGTLDTPRTSPEPGDSSPGSPSPPVEESQSMHRTLSGTNKTPRDTPSPPPVGKSSTTATTITSPSSASCVTPTNVFPPEAPTSPKKVTNAALAAQLYHLALAQDAQLGFAKPPTRDYSRALGERAGAVWMWLGEYARRWGKLAGLGKKEKEKEVKKNADNEVTEGAGSVNDNDSGSGRVLGTNAGGLGRTRTLGGLGRTTTLRNLGRTETLDAAAFAKVVEEEAKTKTREDDAKMDEDVNPSTPSTPTTSSRPLATQGDVAMDINAELEMSGIRSTIGTAVAAAEEQAVPVVSSLSRAPAPRAGVAPWSGPQLMDVVDEEQSHGRVTRSAAQRANKRSRPVSHAVTEENKESVARRRTRANTTRVASTSKGKEKARAVEPESDVEMMEDKEEADDDDGSGDYGASRARKSSKAANTRNKTKRGIAMVEAEVPAMGEAESSGSGVTGVDTELEAPSQVATSSTRGRGRPRGRPRKATKKRGG